MGASPSTTRRPSRQIRRHGSSPWAGPSSGATTSENEGPAAAAPTRNGLNVEGEVSFSMDGAVADRLTTAEIVRRERRVQGLPEKVQDMRALRAVARVLARLSA